MFWDMKVDPARNRAMDGASMVQSLRAVFMSCTGTMETHPVLRRTFIYTPSPSSAPLGFSIHHLQAVYLVCVVMYPGSFLKSDFCHLTLCVKP